MRAIEIWGKRGSVAFDVLWGLDYDAIKSTHKIGFQALPQQLCMWEGKMPLESTGTFFLTAQCRRVERLTFMR